MASRTQNLLLQALDDRPEPEMIELTPEMRQRHPVVNNARGRRGKLQGVTDFFANEHVQNALLQFGRAFASHEGSAANVLADFGQGMLASDANRRATAAFESGGNISDAGGDFADPEFMASLISQQHAMQISERGMTVEEQKFMESIRQFDQQIGLEERMVELREWGAEDDSALAWHRVNQDQEQFETQMELKRQQHELDEKIAESNRLFQEARTEFTMAQVEQLGAEGAGTVSGAQYNNLLLRAQHTLGLLSEQEQTTRNELRALRAAQKDIEKRQNIWRWARLPYYNRKGDSQTLEGAQQGLEERGIVGLDGDDLDSYHESISEQINETQTRLGNLRSDSREITQMLVDARPDRLGGSGGEVSGETTPEGGTTGTNPTDFPVGSPGSAPETPRTVEDPDDVGMDGNGYYRYGGVTYFIQDGSARPVLN